MLCLPWQAGFFMSRCREKTAFIHEVKTGIWRLKAVHCVVRFYEGNELNPCYIRKNKRLKGDDSQSFVYPPQ